VGEEKRPALKEFEVVADAGRRHAAHHALHAFTPLACAPPELHRGAKIATIAIINKRGTDRPAHRGHAVPGVIRVAGGAAVDLLRHVAVGVVTEDRAPRAHHSSLIFRSHLPDATGFYLLTFKTVSTCYKKFIIAIL
jgi:hypothetical protein